MCPAPIGSPKKPPSRGWVPGLEQALPGHQEQLPQWAPALAVLASLAPSLMTGQWQATRPRTQRGLRSAPTSCGGEGSACLGAGRGGVARGPSSSWEEAGKRRGARRMCGSACLPGGGAASPALPLPAHPPPQVAESSGATTPGGRGRSWGGARVGISVKPRRGPGWCRFVTHRPDSHQLAGALTPASSRRPGIPRVGGQRREKCPASSTFL